MNIYTDIPMSKKITIIHNRNSNFFEFLGFETAFIVSGVMTDTGGIS